MVSLDVRGNNLGTAERLVGQAVMFPGSWAPIDSVGHRKPPSPDWFSVHAARGWNGRSCQDSECCGARWCALKRPGQISSGQSVAPPREGGGVWFPSPEGAAQTDASIVSPLQGLFAATIRYPGRRRRALNSRRLALG